MADFGGGGGMHLTFVRKHAGCHVTMAKTIVLKTSHVQDLVKTKIDNQ